MERCAAAKIKAAFDVRSEWPVRAISGNIFHPAIRAQPLVEADLQQEIQCREVVITSGGQGGPCYEVGAFLFFMEPQKLFARGAVSRFSRASFDPHHVPR